VKGAPRHPGKQRSIRRQLVITISGVHAIAMISLMTDIVQRHQSFLLEKANSQIIRQAELLAASTAPQLITDDLAGIDDVLRYIRRDTAVRWAAITDAKGLVKGDSEHHRQGKYYVDETSLLTLKEKNSKLVQQTRSLVTAAAPVFVEGEVLGWAWISRDLSSEMAQVEEMRRTGYIYTTVAIIAGALLATLLASQITRQLRLLLAGTERLAQDRFDTPVPIVTDNDVGAVARAFNDALSRLDTTRLQLLKTQTDLEAEVRERRLAETRLQDANRALTSANEGLTQFAYAASHDLQEPLRSITGYSELLRRRYTGKFDKDADEFLGYIHEGGQRMQRLIKALLEYSRAGSQGPETQRVVNCNAALAMALQNLAIAIEGSSAEVQADSLPEVLAHEVAVVQLFQNLIGNAIKYAGPTRPRIRIAAERAERFWTISVCDNGVGIPADQHKRIFGIFKRAHGKDYPGAGVGLAICAKIVERYGGSITVNSGPGKGAEFRFTLPAAGDRSTDDSPRTRHDILRAGTPASPRISQL
jgi:signal transduction histidine kinase